MTLPDAFHAPVAGGVVELTGDDRARYLEDVTTQHVLELAPGEVVGALHLDAHGSPLAVFDVAALADRWLLLVPDDALADWVVETLGGRTFLLDARFARTDHAWLAVRAPSTTLSAAGLAVPAGRVHEQGDLVLVGVGSGTDVLVPGDRADDLRRRLVDAGVPPGGPGDLERWRVAAGLPAWGRELAAPHLPEEAGVLPTHVHLAKGCYPGQEAVARMWMLGRPRRRLATVEVAGGVEAGWSTGRGRGAVTVTSAADGAGLAYVPAEAGVGDEFREDDAVVRVTGFVGGDAVPPGHDPAMTRRRDTRPGRSTVRPGGGA